MKKLFSIISNLQTQAICIVDLYKVVHHAGAHMDN